MKFTQVPFKGGAETQRGASLGGHTMAEADSHRLEAAGRCRQLRLLNIWTAERTPELARRADPEGAGLPT